MESAHRELGAGLPDGLGSDNSYRFSYIYQLSCSQVVPVTLDANSMTGLTGDYGTDANFFNASVYNFCCSFLIDKLIRVNQYFSSFRMQNIFQGEAPNDALSKVFNNIIAIF